MYLIPILRSVKIRVLILLVLIINTASAQQNDTLIKKLTVLRDSYISEIKSFGFNPSLAPPVIVLDNPRSFGNYDDEKNILHTCDWNTLPVQMHQLFDAFGKNLAVRVTLTCPVCCNGFEKLTLPLSKKYSVPQATQR